MGASISVVSMVAIMSAIVVAIMETLILAPMVTEWLAETRLGKSLGIETPQLSPLADADHALLTSLVRPPGRP